MVGKDNCEEVPWAGGGLVLLPAPVAGTPVDETADDATESPAVEVAGTLLESKPDVGPVGMLVTVEVELPALVTDVISPDEVPVDTIVDDV